MVSRREFVRICTLAGAAVGLSATTVSQIVEAAAKGLKPSVVWLHFQECTGCTESLLRTSHPGIAEVILDLISLDYHETVMAPSGHDAEAALQDAMKANDGKFVLVVEGSVPTADGGIYLTVAGQKGIDRIKAVADRAAAVIAIGSCAAWGGVQSSGINPTGAVGVVEIIKNKPIVNIPGCPPNPYVTLAVVLQYARTGTLPELDELKRPKFAYDRVIHDHCPRRPHFDAGRFAAQFGDEGHRKGWCLYKLGCKGPVTHAPCSTRHFNDVVDAWPIGIGAPCFGCTEKAVGYTVALAETAPIVRPFGPDTYPGIHAEREGIDPVSVGVAGVIAGAVAGAGYMASRKFDNTHEE